MTRMDYTRRDESRRLVARSLKLRREELGLSRQFVLRKAAEAELHDYPLERHWLSKIEDGRMRLTFSELLFFATLYRCSVDFLLAAVPRPSLTFPESIA